MCAEQQNSIAAYVKVGDVVFGKVWSETTARAVGFIVIVKANAVLLSDVTTKPARNLLGWIVEHKVRCNRADQARQQSQLCNRSHFW
jgi:hypothetical protein